MNTATLRASRAKIVNGQSVVTAGFVKRKTVNSGRFIIYLSLLISVLDNQAFWTQLFDRFQQFSLYSVAFSLSILFLHAGLLALILSAFNHRRLFKPALYVLIFISGVVAYLNGMGVVLDKEVLISTLQTDYREASELFNPKLVWHGVIYILMPSLVLYKMQLKYPEKPLDHFKGVAQVVALLVLAVGLVYGNYKYVSFFGRQHSDLKVYLNPIYPILQSIRLLRDSLAEDPVFNVIGADAYVTKSEKKKMVGIFIVGETARADHFQLNGYPRNTSPLLAKRSQLFNFSNVISCGTSTAFSVPCMFSFVSMEDYTPNLARSQSNVLDVLTTAGVQAIWQDNNSSCKGVCTRIESKNFRKELNGDSIYYNDGEYVDEVLLSNLDDLIEQSNGDLLIVLHPLGSHGPAYHKRYPEEFAIFDPACQSDSPQLCSREEVVNAYDNTILYADFLINETISKLERFGDDIQSFVYYAADHGESLGEDGVYLHGLPRAIAPIEQRHVPMMLWLSEGNDFNQATPRQRLKDCKNRSLSHDVISHTLLQLFNVETSVLIDDLSLVGGACH